MPVAAVSSTARRPRFRRATNPPAFRLTDGDIEIIRHIAQHRMIRSTHIAVLIGRSLDRTNERLMRLFHAGYVDRPRAQIDRFPTGAPSMVYALADGGIRLLREHDGRVFANREWSRKNREARRPFIEHQTEIVNFEVAVECAMNSRSDLRLIRQDQLQAAARPLVRASRAPFALRGRISARGWTREKSVIPDLVFALQHERGERRNFVVEIDRGTMPVKRADPYQTSFQGKERVYLSAYAAKQHTRQFGWQSFRVLTITTDWDRVRTMQDALRDVYVPRSLGAPLFLFTTFADLAAADPLSLEWRDGNGKGVRLLERPTAL